jgi:hypothetical protein
MTTRIVPAPGVHLFYLDDAGILFAESTQELHGLNTTAAVIWTLLEEGHDAEGVAVALQAMYALEPARAREFVASALDAWMQKGLLDDVGAKRAAAPPATTEPKPANGRAWEPFEAIETRHYRLLTSRMRLRCSTAAAARIVHPILAHLEAPPSDGEIDIDIVDGPDGIDVYRERVLFERCRGIDALAPIVKSLVWMTAVRDHAFFLDIHAGVIGDGRACILLPAAPGSGKSTLTASLAHAGLQYFSDEVALLSERLDVYPVPLAICVKAAGVAALADRFPELRHLPVHRRGDGKDVIYLPPPAAALPPTREARPVAAIVFPKYRADAATALLRLGKLEALQRLLSECLIVTPPLDRRKVEALVRWIDTIPCYGLDYGQTEEAMAAVRDLFAT